MGFVKKISKSVKKVGSKANKQLKKTTMFSVALVDPIGGYAVDQVQKKGFKEAFAVGGGLQKLADPLDLFQLRSKQAAVDAADRQADFAEDQAGINASNAAEQARGAALSVQADM